MRKRRFLILLFAGTLIFLLAGCRSAGITPGTDTGTDSSISGTADEVKINIKNVLTENQAQEMIQWLNGEPQTYQAITEKYGKPNHFSRKGEMRYTVENNGKLYLSLISETDTRYEVNRLKWDAILKNDIYLEQFLAFVAGVTTVDEVQKAVGAPHDFIGSGIVRDLYYTADGCKISVYYSENRVYEIRLHHDDGTNTILMTLNPNA